MSEFERESVSTLLYQYNSDLEERSKNIFQFNCLRFSCTRYPLSANDFVLKVDHIDQTISSKVYTYCKRFTDCRTRSSLSIVENTPCSSHSRSSRIKLFVPCHRFKRCDSKCCHKFRKRATKGEKRALLWEPLYYTSTFVPRTCRLKQ